MCCCPPQISTPATHLGLASSSYRFLSLDRRWQLWPPRAAPGCSSFSALSAGNSLGRGQRGVFIRVGQRLERHLPRQSCRHRRCFPASIPSRLALFAPPAAVVRSGLGAGCSLGRRERCLIVGIRRRLEPRLPRQLLVLGSAQSWLLLQGRRSVLNYLPTLCQSVMHNTPAPCTARCACQAAPKEQAHCIQDAVEKIQQAASGRDCTAAGQSLQPLPSIADRQLKHCDARSVRTCRSRATSCSSKAACAAFCRLPAQYLHQRQLLCIASDFVLDLSGAPSLQGHLANVGC